MKNSYSSIKILKTQTCWHKISYYTTSKNFTQVMQDYKKLKKVGSNSSLHSDTKKVKTI